MKQFSTSTLLVQNGVLVTPGGILEADMLVQGECIEAIGRSLPVAPDTVVVDGERLDAASALQRDDRLGDG